MLHPELLVRDPRDAIYLGGHRLGHAEGAAAVAAMRVVALTGRASPSFALAKRASFFKGQCTSARSALWFLIL
jgi:hypothetical protein